MRSRGCQPEDGVCEGTVEEGRACNPQPCIGKAHLSFSHLFGSTQLQVAVIQCNNHAIFKFSQAKSATGVRVCEPSSV